MSSGPDMQPSRPVPSRTGHKPLRVLVLADKVGATQQISFGLPLEQAVAEGRLVLAMESEQREWRQAATRKALWQEHRPDVVVLSRYTGPVASAFVADAQAAGVPSIFHIDDDLLDVPMSLGAAKYAHYHHPDRIDALRSALNGVDLVYASTPALAERLLAHQITAPVISGDLYCSIEPAMLAAPLPAGGPVIGYMGTGGHSADLEMVLPAVARLMEEMPSLRFETFGTISPPAAMQGFGLRYAHHAGVAAYDRFVERLYELGWWVGIAPLEDNAFNRCKADTKWVEYSLVGMAVVATDLPVYHRACADGAGLLAQDTEGWYRALGALVRDGWRRQALVARARQKLRDDYTRKLLQQQVVRILEDVVDRHRAT